MNSAETESPVQDRRTLRRVSGAVLIGTTIEWYDFGLYGAASALVLGPQFFPSFSAVSQTLLAFSTFAVGFFMRPLGAVVIGHFGDRVGRKNMLIFSLVLMGVATFLVGLLPSYSRLGVAAPAILVALRILQGFGVGGEWGGAVVAAVEYAPNKRRGLYGSLPQIGAPLGTALALAAFLAVSQIPQRGFMLWGWRIPFLIAVVLVGVGLYVRVRIDETPAFRKMARSTAQSHRIPLLEAFRLYPRQIAVATGSNICSAGYWYVITSFSLSYATDQHLLSRAAILTFVLIASIVTVAVMPYSGIVGERYGRKRMLYIGYIGMGIWIFPIFAAINSGSRIATGIAVILGAVVWCISYGPQATWMTELFDARVRFSASSLSFQLGVMLGGALAPIIATAIVGQTGPGIWVGAYIAGLAAVSTTCLFFINKQDTERGSADMRHLAIARDTEPDG